MKYKIVLVVVIILSLPQLIFAQDFNIIGAGARARGMGGAFIGVADDATATSWNPAGLVRLEKPEASIVGLFESYNVTTDISDYDTDPYKSSHFTLNYLSAAMPLAIGEKNLVAAIAMQQVMDLYYKVEDDQSKEEQTGGVNAITPAIGIQLTPSFSLGASVNIYTGKSNYSSEDKSGFLDPYKSKEEYSGTNFVIGGSFDFNNFRIGVVFKTPFGLKLKSDTYERTLYMPQMLGIGAAFSVSENLTIAADYEMRKYSSTKYEDKDTGEKYKPTYFSPFTEDLKEGWEDINQIRVGAEYLMMSGNNVLPLRAGFATTPTLFTDSEDKQISGINLTAGIGLIMGKLNFDLGFEYNMFAMEIQDMGNVTDNYFRLILAGVFHFGK
jgi:long-subunit fatty acid transport protein